MPSSELDALHEDIDHCRVCQKVADGFRKPSHLDRGQGGRILIVGQGPGKAELNGGKAFAGQSGKTLDSWLRPATGNAEQPRRDIYFTSVIKCCHSRARDFPTMARNCAGFLQRQLALLKPILVITLGKEAYERLKFSGTDYGRALCRPIHSSDHLLISPFAFDFWLLPWPHPSGLNRWHNSSENSKRLERSFPFVRKVMEGKLDRG